MQASIGQYSIHAGDPAQPVQQSVVIASMRGFFLRVALPSPSDMGQCFSTISIIEKFCSERLSVSSSSHAYFNTSRAADSIICAVVRYKLEREVESLYN